MFWQCLPDSQIKIPDLVQLKLQLGHALHAFKLHARGRKLVLMG
jgi:hypothetical protein